MSVSRGSNHALICIVNDHENLMSWYVNVSLELNCHTNIVQLKDFLDGLFVKQCVMCLFSCTHSHFISIMCKLF